MAIRIYSMYRRNDDYYFIRLVEEEAGAKFEVDISDGDGTRYFGELNPHTGEICETIEHRALNGLGIETAVIGRLDEAVRVQPFDFTEE